MPYTLKLTSHNLVIKHTAAVQIVDASDLQANADLQERPISGSGDVCWLTAVPKLASWQRCCWDLSVLAGHRFDPDPTSLTSWQDFCSEQQCWHRHTIRTNCRQTHTRTHAWQTGKYFISLCNVRASGYCTLHQQQDYCKVLQVSERWWIYCFSAHSGYIPITWDLSSSI